MGFAKFIKTVDENRPKNKQIVQTFKEKKTKFTKKMWACLPKQEKLPF
jgi:hypothetical protein